MQPVSICKISKLLPIFKEGMPATNIEVARITTPDGDELQFNVVVQKGLYELGESVMYIMPDYALPDSEIFAEYIRPGGDASKCKLGKRNRIRAIKFNFQFENSTDAIYSNGIIMPLGDIIETTDYPVIDEVDWMAELGVTKYVAEDSFDSQSKGLSKGTLPSFLYATDETRLEGLYKHVNRIFEEDEELSITIKRDGSSVTVFCRKNPIDTEQWEIGICTRNQEKKLDQEYVGAFKDKSTGVILHPFGKKTVTDEKVVSIEKGWMNDSTQQFYTEAEVLNVEKFEPIVTIMKDAWVDTCKKFGYLDGLLEYCKKYDCQLALRGELIGAGNKGSGNKLNQDAKSGESRIVWFGIDSLSSGHATRIDYSQEHNLAKVCEELGFDYTKEVIALKADYDGLITIGNGIFAQEKEKNGTILEGIVIRTKYSNKLSCKYLNNEYDSKA